MAFGSDEPTYCHLCNGQFTPRFFLNDECPDCTKVMRQRSMVTHTDNPLFEAMRHAAAAYPNVEMPQLMIDAVEHCWLKDYGEEPDIYDFARLPARKLAIMLGRYARRDDV